MESTGVYWIPIYNILEEHDLTLLVVNAKHSRNLPGRKTDVKDAEWIADLLRHGLIQGSFIPDREQRELRELVRYRTGLTQDRTREINRVQKVLEGCNIKISSVLSDITGRSGRDILRALLVDYNTDPQALAQLAVSRARNKIPELEEALYGTLGDHQRFLLSDQLEHIDFISQKINSLDQEIDRRLEPETDTLHNLDGIPGVGRIVSQKILAEVGSDMSRFPTDKQLASWAGVVPGCHESAGKRRSSRTRKGNPHLRSALVEAAQAAARTQTYLGAQFRRIQARRGHKKAILAVAHSILIIAYHIIRDGVSYQELGQNYFDELKRTQVVNRSVKRLQALGYTVTLTEPPEPTNEPAA